MKTWLVVLSLSVAGSTAMAGKAVTDCSKAKENIVRIKSIDERLTMSKAAELAYACFEEEKGSSVRNAKAAAIKIARSNERRSCGKELEPLQTMTLSSWTSGRPSIDSEDKATMGGDATILVSQGVKCLGVGTGLFDGIASSVNAKMEVSESYTFNMENDNVPAQQTIEVKLLKVTNDL